MSDDLLDEARQECPHCPDGHARPESRPWAVFVASERDGDGQPTHLYVAPTAGQHVAESDAEWARRLLNGGAMTDDLLDSAERIADERLRRKRLMPDRIAYVLRALVERVRTAEAENRRLGIGPLRQAEADRNEAQAKLDAVRLYIERHERKGSLVNPRDVLAILDGK